MRVLDHDGRGPQLPLLTRGLARPDPAADDHRVVGGERLGRRARLQLLGVGGEATSEGGEKDEEGAVHHGGGPFGG